MTPSTPPSKHPAQEQSHTLFGFGLEMAGNRSKLRRSADPYCGAGEKSITLPSRAGDPPPAGGYRIYHDQSGKLQLRAEVGVGTLTYKDTGLTSRVTYTYVVTAFNTCSPTIAESAPSNKVSATAQ